jgi:hypothetical protein
MPGTLIGVALMYAGLGTIGLGAISLLARLAGAIVIVAARNSVVPDGTPEDLDGQVSRHSRAGL